MGPDGTASGADADADAYADADANTNAHANADAHINAGANAPAGASAGSYAAPVAAPAAAAPSDGPGACKTIGECASEAAQCLAAKLASRNEQQSEGQGNRVNGGFGNFRIGACPLETFPNAGDRLKGRKESESPFTRFPWSEGHFVIEYDQQGNPRIVHYLRDTPSDEENADAADCAKDLNACLDSRCRN